MTNAIANLHYQLIVFKNYTHAPRKKCSQIHPKHPSSQCAFAKNRLKKDDEYFSASEKQKKKLFISEREPIFQWKTSFAVEMLTRKYVNWVSGYFKCSD